MSFVSYDLLDYFNTASKQNSIYTTCRLAPSSHILPTLSENRKDDLKGFFFVLFC